MVYKEKKRARLGEPLGCRELEVEVAEGEIANKGKALNDEVHGIHLRTGAARTHERCVLSKRHINGLQ